MFHSHSIIAMVCTKAWLLLPKRQWSPALDSKSFGVCILSCVDVIVVAEINRFAWNLRQMFMCYAKLTAYFLVQVVEIARVRGYLKISLHIMIYRGKLHRFWHDYCALIFIEIYILYSDSHQSTLFRKWVHIAKTARVQGYTKE